MTAGCAWKPTSRRATVRLLMIAIPLVLGELATLPRTEHDKGSAARLGVTERDFDVMVAGDAVRVPRWVDHADDNLSVRCR